MTFVVAIDGTSGSGKGTIAEALAEAFDLPYLDTGLLYRAVGAAMLENGHNLDEEAVAARIAGTLSQSQLADPNLRSVEAGEAASRIAAHPAVRKALLALQENFARQPCGAVLDGRDIGTVIAPFADAKLFVDAEINERARRRWLQTSARGDPSDVQSVLEDLRRRDARDSARIAAPLLRANDAVLIDTTQMSIPEAADAARRIVEAARARWLDFQTSG